MYGSAPPGTAPAESSLRPEPVATVDSRFFWEGAKNGELLIQQCCGCHTLWHPPRPMCAKCHSLKLAPAKMSGRGRVYSWCMPIHPFPFGFQTPPLVALIDLEEGPRLVSNVVGLDPREMKNGIEVMVEFEPAQNGAAVPVFRPVVSGEVA